MEFSEQLVAASIDEKGTVREIVERTCEMTGATTRWLVTHREFEKGVNRIIESHEES